MALVATIVVPIAAPVLGQSYSSRSSGSSSGSNYGSSNYDSFTSRNDSMSGFSSSSRRKTGSSSRYDNQRTDVDKQRDTNTRNETRDRNSRQTGPSATDNKNATPAPGGKTLSTVKGKQPVKTSDTGGASRATTNVEFKMKADPTTNLLLVETLGQQPTLNIQAIEGERFATRVAFQNNRNSQFDSIDVSLKYDPKMLEPLGIDDSANEKLLSEPSIARVDARRGVLAYHAKFTQPLSNSNFGVFKVVWRALSPAEYTAIAFLNNTEFPSRVLNAEANVLHAGAGEQMEISEDAGLLPASVAVLPGKDRAAQLEENGGDDFTGMVLAGQISQGVATGGVTLSLRPRQRTVDAGDTFLVDIVYSNPNRADVDTMKLKVVFDPSVLQVVDYDTDNWITRDVNIFDGDYHEDLPFDFHRKNQAFNATGEILYWMGFSNRVRMPSSAVVASIRFKAIAPSASTEISFDLQENEREQRTAVSFLGFNLIGEPGTRANALTSASVRVN